MRRYFRERAFGALRVKTIVQSVDENEEYRNQLHTQRFEGEVRRVLGLLISLHCRGVTPSDFDLETNK